MKATRIEGFEIMIERGGCAIGIEHKSGIYGSWDASSCRGRVRGLVRRRLGAVSKLSVQKKNQCAETGMDVLAHQSERILLCTLSKSHLISYQG